MSAHHPQPAAATTGDHSDHEPFVSMRLWLNGSPWRLSGGWLFLAGLVASTGWRAASRHWLAVVLALVLAEVFWGALWSQLVPTQSWPRHAARRRPALPYIHPSSPAGRLLGWPAPGAASAIVRTGLPLTALALLLAALVGRAALLWTGLVVLMVLVAMALQRAELPSLAGWLQALAQAAAPFGLGVFSQSQWPDAPLDSWLLSLALGYTLLTRSLITTSAKRNPPDGSDADGSFARLILAGSGVGVVAAVLLWAMLPVSAGIVGALAVAPLLALARSGVRSVRAAQPWLLAVVLASAVALSLGPG